MEKFDVCIIGAGIGGLMAAHKIKVHDPKTSVVIVEKGQTLERRKCPASAERGCVHCGICAITNGYGGAGARSDGKLNVGTAYGGILGDELGETKAMKYIREVDSTLESFADVVNGVRDYPEMFLSNEDLKLKCLQNNLRLLDMDVRHLGTDRNFNILKNIIKHLADVGVDMRSGTEIENVEYENGKWHVTGKDTDIEASNLIIAVGRVGAGFVSKFCNKFGIRMKTNAVDIGVRVEMKDAIWREFSSRIYEPKILCRTKTFEDKTRMFCFNQGGIVSAENNNGIITANGHSFSDKSKKTDNCNFAILSSINFTEPFNKPTEFVESISRLANSIGNGNVLVQRFGDLVRGRRTNDHRLGHSTVIPTLKATPGDISLVMPHRILTNIIDTIYALDKVAPGTANDDTLLYGCEAKYYSIRPEHKPNFEVMDGAYIIGDCSGITRGLSQAGAMGLFVADDIAGRTEV